MPDEPDTGSRSRGYSTMDSKCKSNDGELPLDDRESCSDANLDFTHVAPDGNVNITAAWVSRRGYYPENLNKENQDSYSFHPEFGERPPG